MVSTTSEIISGFENEQKSTVFSALSEYLSTGLFVDISLVCKGQVLRAHKVVLSSSSKYFRDIFRHQPNISIIDLDKELAPNDLNLTLEDVQLIIGILYCVGTVEISPQRIETLLVCAQVLGIPTLISFLKRIRESITNKLAKDGSSLEYHDLPCPSKVLVPPSRYTGSAVVPPLSASGSSHRRSSGEMMYILSPTRQHYSSFPPPPSSALITSPPASALITPPEKSLHSSGYRTGDSTFPLLDLSLVKPMTASCINSPEPSISRHHPSRGRDTESGSPQPGPSGVKDTMLFQSKKQTSSSSRHLASRISNSSYSSFSLNCLQSPRLKSTDACEHQGGSRVVSSVLDGIDQNLLMHLNNLPANQLDDLENVLLPHLTTTDTRSQVSPGQNLLDLPGMEMSGSSSRSITSHPVEPESPEPSEVTSHPAKRSPAEEVNESPRRDSPPATIPLDPRTPPAADLSLAKRMPPANISMTHRTPPAVTTMTQNTPPANISMTQRAPSADIVLTNRTASAVISITPRTPPTVISMTQHTPPADIAMTHGTSPVAELALRSPPALQSNAEHQSEPESLVQRVTVTVIKPTEARISTDRAGAAEHSRTFTELDGFLRAQAGRRSSSDVPSADLNFNHSSNRSASVPAHIKPQSFNFFPPIPPRNRSAAAAVTDDGGAAIIGGEPAQKRQKRPSLSITDGQPAGVRLTPFTIPQLTAIKPVRITPQGGITLSPLKNLLSPTKTSSRINQNTDANNETEDEAETEVDGAANLGENLEQPIEESAANIPTLENSSADIDQHLEGDDQTVRSESYSDYLLNTVNEQNANHAEVQSLSVHDEHDDQADRDGYHLYDNHENEDDQDDHYDDHNQEPVEQDDNHDEHQGAVHHQQEQPHQRGDHDHHQSETDSGHDHHPSEIIMNLDQVCQTGQKMKFSIPGVSQAVTLNFSAEALQEMKNAALNLNSATTAGNDAAAAVPAEDDGDQNCEISSSRLPSSAESDTEGLQVLPKKPPTRKMKKNLRQKLKSNLTASSRMETVVVGEVQNTNYPCDVCGKRFTTELQLKKHHKFHVEKNFPCDHCHVILDKRWQYDKHMETVHGIKERHDCPECEQVFYQRTELMAHLQSVHQSKKLFKCQVCHLDFGGKQHLLNHLSTWHPTLKASICQICMEIFEDVVSLDSHACPGAEVTNRNIICHQHETPVKLTSRVELDHHMKTHHREESTKFQISCCICQKTFLLKKNLWKHLRNIHNLETGGKVTRREFPCSVCSRTFYYKNDLTNHMEKHSTEKKYKCSNCDRCFFTVKSQKRHERSECDQELVCALCGKRLTTAAKLKAHRLTHSQDRPFPCRYCAQRFKEKRCMLKHVNNKHKDLVENQERSNDIVQSLNSLSATAGLTESRTVHIKNPQAQSTAVFSNPQSQTLVAQIGNPPYLSGAAAARSCQNPSIRMEGSCSVSGEPCIPRQAATLEQSANPAAAVDQLIHADGKSLTGHIIYSTDETSNLLHITNMEDVPAAAVVHEMHTTALPDTYQPDSTEY